MASSFLIDELIKRQIYLQRFAAGEAKTLQPFLEDTLTQVIRMVERGELQHFSEQKIKELLGRLFTLIDTGMDAYTAQFMSDAELLASMERNFNVSILQAGAIPVVQAPTVSLVRAAYTKRQMELIAGDKIKKLTLEQAFEQFGKRQKKEVAKAIRQGITMGETSTEIANRIRAQVPTRTAQQSQALVRTSVNHITATARAEVNRVNSDILDGERFLATLDSITSITCASKDGLVFPIDEGPMPPLHFSCRSQRIGNIKPELRMPGFKRERASIDGPVDAQTTYGGWLKRQTPEVQDEVLGMERAKLFRSGKLSVGKFTDNTGKVYSLEKLEELHPQAFE